MRARLGVSSYHVALDQEDVRSFAERWPCYGERRAIAFVFERETGDLLDIEGEHADNDESGIAELSNDACLAGAIALRLDSVAEMRRVFGDPDSVAILLEHVAESAPA
jgi:hypothetical protein